MHEIVSSQCCFRGPINEEQEYVMNETTSCTRVFEYLGLRSFGLTLTRTILGSSISSWIFDSSVQIVSHTMIISWQQDAFLAIPFLQDEPQTIWQLWQAYSSIEIKACITLQQYSIWEGRRGRNKCQQMLFYLTWKISGMRANLHGKGCLLFVSLYTQFNLLSLIEEVARQN